MITNQFILPNPLLKPFVSNYLLATSHGQDLNFSSQWAASNEICFMFFLRDRVRHKNNQTEAALTGKRNCCIGPLTRYNGILDFTGTPVQLKLAPVTSVHTVPHASYFAKTSGVTVGEWINISARITDDMPFTGTQYWKETPTGTRQLNAYRVEAVIDKARLFALPPHHSSADKIPSTNKEAIP